MRVPAGPGGTPYSQKIETVAKWESYARRDVSLRVVYRRATRPRTVPEVTRCRPGRLRLRRPERLNRERPRAQQFILQSARKPLRLNTLILGYFTAKSLYCLVRNLTLNQRVPGSSLVRRDQANQAPAIQRIRTDLSLRRPVGNFCRTGLLCRLLKGGGMVARVTAAATSQIPKLIFCPRPYTSRGPWGPSALNGSPVRRK
jgi:hypothetical protein